MLLVTLWFGLNPRSYLFRNQIDWTREPEGLTFADSGIAYTGPVPSEYFLSDTDDVSFTVDLGLVLAKVPPDGFAVLLQLASEDTTTQFLFGQWRHELVVMTGDDYSFRKRLPRITLKMETSDEPVHRLILAAGPDGTVVYHNGRLVQFHPQLKCRVFETGANAWWVLGNSLRGSHPWKGTLKWVAVSRGILGAEKVRKRDREYRENGFYPLPSDQYGENVLAFSFSSDAASSIVDRSGSGFKLTIPEHRTYMIPDFFRDSFDNFEWSAGFASDLFWNLFGIVPVGFTLALMLDRGGHGLGLGRWMTLVLAGSTLSLIIEFTQAWIPSRSSSSLDWILNSVGIALAGGLYLFCLRILRRVSRISKDKRGEGNLGWVIDGHG